MKPRSFEKRLRMFRRYAATYLVILMLAVVPTFLLTRNSIAMQRELLDEAALKRLSNAAETMDIELAVIFTSLNVLATDHYIRQLPYVSPNAGISTYERRVLREVRRLVSAVTPQLSYQARYTTAGVVLYAACARRFITSHTVYLEPYYLKFVFNYDSSQLMAAIEQMNHPTGPSTVILNVGSASAPHYLHLYRLGRDWAPLPVIAIIEYSTEKVGRLTNSIGEADFVYMINASGEYMKGYAGIPIYLLPGYGSFAGNTGRQTVLVDGVEYIATWATSSFSDWKYISMHRVDEFYHGIRTLIWVTVIYTITFCALAAVLAYVIFKRQYNTLDKIIRHNQMLTEEKLQTQRQMEHLKGDFLQSSEWRLNDFVFKIISGLDNADRLESQLKMYDIEFKYDAYLVILVKILDFDNYAQADTPQEWSLVRGAVHSAISEMLPYSMLKCDISQESIGILVNFLSSDMDAERKVRDACDEARKTLMDKLGVSICVVLGRTVPDWKQSQESYRYAFRMFELINSIGINRLANSQGQTVLRYEYSLDLEMRLLRHLQGGEVEECRKELLRIFDDAAKANLNMKSQEHLYYDLLTTATRAINMLPPVMMDEIYAYSRQLVAFSAYRSVEDVQGVILDFYDNVCRIVAQMRTGLVKQADIAQVIDYLHDNYHDINLTQAAVADYFHMQASSLSLLFKKRQGVNMMDYLHSLRIEHAKRLLLSSQDSKVSDIAAQSGFSSVKTFIRVFKSYTGVTPGRYHSINMRSSHGGQGKNA